MEEVVFGPRHEQAAEASALIELGAGFSVASADKLVELAKKMTKDPAWSIKNNQLAENFVRERTGATMRIMDFIAEKDILVKNKVL